MDLNKLTLFQMAKRRLDWSAQRQVVLSQNVANADTPGYKPSDLRPLDFGKMVRQKALQPQQVKPLQTDPRHLPGTIPDRGPYRADKARKAFDATLDGNMVVLEEQMMKVSQTNSGYDLTMNLFRKHVTMLRTALGKGR